MNIRTVRAMLCFNTPTGRLCKDVNWSYYEAKAMLTTSTTPIEAFSRFLINSRRIINSSKMDLGYLHTIQFYEEKRQRNGSCIKHCCTKTIKVGKNMELKVLEE